MKKTGEALYGAHKAAKRSGASIEQLRYWEIIGIVQPKYVRSGARRLRRYSEADILRANFVKTLMEVGKYSLQGALHKLKKSDFNDQLEFGFRQQVQLAGKDK